MLTGFNRTAHRALVITALAAAATFAGSRADAQSFRVAPILQTHIHPNSVAFADFNSDGIVDMAVPQYEWGLTVFIGNGRGGFTEGATYACGNPRASIARDLNGDGHADVVVSDERNSSVWVFIGDGLGGLAAGIRYPVGTKPYYVTMADFDGDGHPDLATANAGAGTVSVLPGDGTGRFGPQVQYPVGTTPRSVAAADFNSDGHLDLAVGNFGSNTVSVLFGDGAGGFGAAFEAATGAAPYLITAGDVNGDGHADLVVPDYNDGTVGIFYGNGLGQFPASQSFATGKGPRHASITDLNSDGIADVIVTNRDASSISILFGDGAGGLRAPRTYGVGSGPFFTARADLDRDGRLDLIVVNRDAYTISIFAGDDTGVLAAPVPLLVGSGPRGIAAADFDGDGRIDLALPSYYGNTITVLRGAGDGTASPAGTYSVGRSPWGAVTADFDRDGAPDLAVVNSGQNTISVLRNLGGGSFAAQRSFIAGAVPTAVVSADLNNDGKPDLIAVNSGGASISVLLGDGAGGFAAATSHAVGTSPNAAATGDFNGDGRVDLAVTNADSSNITILLGDGAGGFVSSASIATPAKPAGIAGADFNRDGTLDLAVVSSSTNVVTIFAGDGLGGFTSTHSLAVGTTPLAVAAGDFDGDGILDLVTANAGADTISVLRGTGTGDFAAARSYGVGIYPRALALADFDGDGRTDIGVGNANSNDAWVVVNTTGHGDLGVTIDDGFAHISPGQRVRYTVTVTNSGPSDVGTAPVSAVLPAGSSDISWVCAGSNGGVCSAAGGGGLSDNAFVPVDGAVTYSVDVTLPSSASGSLEARAFVTMAPGDDPNPANNEAVDVDGVLSNHAPVAQNGSKTTDEDVAVAVTLAATDADGDALTWRVLTPPAHGTLSGSAPSLTYSPAANFNGTDAFTFQVNDGLADSNVATISISVSPVNDAPSANALSVTTSQDVGVAVNLSGSDVDGDALSFAVAAPPAHGTLSGAAPALTYTPDAGYSGPDSFTYTAFDGQATSAPAAVSIAVTKPNHPPFIATAIPDVNVADDSTSVSVDLSSTFGDPDLADGDTLTLSVAANSNPSLVTPSLTGSLLRLGLAPGVSGSSTLRVRATDARGLYVEDDFVVTVNRPPLNVSIADASVVEGNSGTRSLIFSLTLSASSTSPVTVTYTSANGTAAAGSDYTAASGSVVFNPGVTARTISLVVAGDTIDETDETVLVRLTGATGALVSRAEATGTIVDDDTASLSVADLSVTERNDGTAVAVFQVTMSVPNSRPVTVDYASANGTALAGADYTAASGTLTFAPGTQALTISVPITGDTMDEPNEKFTITLSNAANATLARPTGTATIVDDDDPPTVSIDDVTVVEGNVSTTATFTVHLSAASGYTTRVQFATSNGTAIAGSDYRSGTGSVTFSPGVTTAVVNVVLLADRVAEPTETFFVTLSAPTLLTIDRAQATGTILDDDGGSLP